MSSASLALAGAAALTCGVTSVLDWLAGFAYRAGCWVDSVSATGGVKRGLDGAWQDRSGIRLLDLLFDFNSLC